jgi:HEAT repeat protein
MVRLGAVNALGDIGLKPESVIPVLRTALSDPDHLVKRDAAAALGSFGPTVIPDLTRALGDPVWEAREGALTGLGKTAARRPTVVLPLLEKGLHDDIWIVRRSAAYALGFSGSKAALNILFEATNDAEIGDIIYQFKQIQNHSHDN